MKSLLTRYKEPILYVVFGGLTTVVSVGSFWLLQSVLHQNPHVANTVSWILAVLFAFLTNRRFVFEADTASSRTFWRQLAEFYGGRLATFAIEEVILLIFITWLRLDALVVKLAAQVVVLILNYLISKIWIFRKNAQN